METNKDQIVELKLSREELLVVWANIPEPEKSRFPEICKRLLEKISSALETLGCSPFQRY